MPIHPTAIRLTPLNARLAAAVTGIVLLGGLLGFGSAMVAGVDGAGHALIAAIPCAFAIALALAAFIMACGPWEILYYSREKSRCRRRGRRRPLPPVHSDAWRRASTIATTQS